MKETGERNIWCNSLIGMIGLSLGLKGEVRRLELGEGAESECKMGISLQLDEYFRGERKKFRVELDYQGTAFQEDVWRVLQEIPYGETRTYKYIAEEIGRPKAIRAVGTAIGNNPIPIIIPCHRVIATGGGLGGYALGVEVKKSLLKLEEGNPEQFITKK